MKNFQKIILALIILAASFFSNNNAIAVEIKDSSLSATQVASITQIRAVGLQTVGSVIVWNQAGDPGDMYNDDGRPVWLECDGSSFDTGYYTALASIIPSGVLPNLKDQFLRGGTSAQVGQTVQDSTREHYHGQPSHTHSVGTMLTSTAVSGNAAPQYFQDRHTGMNMSESHNVYWPGAGLYRFTNSVWATNPETSIGISYGYGVGDATYHYTEGSSAVAASVNNGSASGTAASSGGDNTYKNSNSDGTNGGSETAPKHIRVRYLIRALP